MSDLRERLAEVARLRRDAYSVETALADAQNEAAKTPEAQRVQALYETRKGITAALIEAETLAKQEALAEYDQTQVKRPMPGVEIKTFKVVYFVAREAEKWCRFNATNFLILDGKRFEKAVRDGALRVPEEIASVSPELRAQLASDLSEYEEVNE